MIKITVCWGNVIFFKERVNIFNSFRLENIQYNITPITDKKAEERLPCPLGRKKKMIRTF